MNHNPYADVETLIREDIRQAEHFLETTILVNTPFIVGRHGEVWVRSIETDQDNVLTKVHVTDSPLKAAGFTREDAERLAASVANGNGQFQAVARRDAVKAFLPERRGLLAFLEQSNRLAEIQDK